MLNFHSDVRSKFANHDSRLTTLEEKIDSVSSSDHAIDSHARECINRVEQQMIFLSISLSSKAQASSSVNQQSSKLDPRITTDQSCTMIAGGFPEQGFESECTKWSLAEIQKLCNCQPTRAYVKGAFRKLLCFKFDNMQVCG